MSVLKCKICGGTLELTGDASVCVCQYCGTKQTLPKPSDEHVSTLYERADHFRRNNDFDKAIQIYEQILNENATDAEAYWLLVLCRYGVEYVEDPKSSKRIATVNRMQYTSVLSDEDYKAAIRYADLEQKTIYEAEAHEIDTIQKGILAISQKEKPFDVFICYKETDNNGRRTQDSVLANELYHQLTNEGFKVFFSRITLEDKLGSAYEPYIFAALNSAKVMVVLGTKPEYFNAVWVRNEWSRFLALIKNGANKVLIPAYRDMDPYDLPEEFSHLQAQDMSKLGFMQDLIRGIEKLAGVEKPSRAAAVAVPAPSASGVDPLLRRMSLFLEDGDWASADEYCEKVLDQNPECGEAYLGKLMVKLKVRRREQLAEQAQPFDDHPDYQKAVRFGDAALREELETAIHTIQNKAERDRLLAAYRKAEAQYAAARTREDFLAAAVAFEALNGFEDAATRASTCREQADAVYYGGLYTAAAALMQNAKTAEDYTKAAAAFEAIGDYRDAAALQTECADKAAFTEKEAAYTAAVALMAGGKIKNYKKAMAVFETIRGFKDADIKIDDCERRILEIQAAASVSLAAKEKRAAARKENLKQKLPLIKKVALVVVPVLILGILAAMILPTIDFSQLAKTDPTTTTAAGGKPTTTLGAASPTSTTQPTTQTTAVATESTTAGVTESTSPASKPSGKPTTRPTVKPTAPVDEPSEPPSQDGVWHAEECPFAGGKHADIFAKEKGTLFLSCHGVGYPDGTTSYETVSHGWYDGKMYYRYEYDSNAHLIGYSEILYTSEDHDVQVSYTGIEYDTNGKMRYKWENFTKDGYEYSCTYRYDNGRLFDKQEGKTDAKGTVTNTDWYYNTAGTVVDKRVEVTNANGDVTRRQEFKYDAAGKLVYQVEHEFLTSQTITVTIYNAKKSVICKMYGEGGEHSVTSTCNANGEYYNTYEGECVYEEKNAAGNPVFQAWVGMAGPGMSPWVIYYQYDSKGNLISRQETWYSRSSVGDFRRVTYDADGTAIDTSFWYRSY